MWGAFRIEDINIRKHLGLPVDFSLTRHFAIFRLYLGVLIIWYWAMRRRLSVLGQGSMIFGFCILPFNTSRPIPFSPSLAKTEVPSLVSPLMQIRSRTLSGTVLMRLSPSLNIRASCSTDKDRFLRSIYSVDIMFLSDQAMIKVS